MVGAGTLVARRVFSEADQRDFAQLSGDDNPLHTDPLAARRLLFGGPVVHGVHALLWTLCSLSDQSLSPGSLESLSVQFRKPIMVGMPVSLALSRKTNSEFKLVVESERGPAAIVVASLGRVAASSEAELPRPDWGDARPANLDAAGVAHARGELTLALDRQVADDLLPGWSSVLTPVQLAQLLATSRLVGTQCPGLHSVFGELSVRFQGDSGDPLQYEATSWDPRFARVSISLTSSGMEGTIVSFLRPPPQDQVRSGDLDMVLPDEFAGQRALVVGGSRGLGEVCAKLLAAGGASVVLTFSKGEADARRTVEDITGAGGDATAVRLDVLAPASLGSSSLHEMPTHLYYFASPFAFDGVPGRFSNDLFHKYCSYYVTGLADLVAGLRDRSDSLVALFNPSSVALVELTPGMAEYSAAKAAGELLCESLARTHSGLRTRSARLPRLATDQTRTLLAFESADPVPVLLAELRDLSRAQR